MASQQTHDPRVLKAIAHPVRARVLAEFYARTSARAADLARELDLPANQLSFHLRQLARYGLIEEAPEEARDRRDRVWRIVNTEGLNVRLGEMEQQPGGKAAVSIFREQARAWGHHLVDRVVDHRPDGTTGTINDASIRLSPEEVDEFQRELAEVFVRWRDKTSGDDAERTTYSHYAILQPYPDLSTDPAEDDA